MKATVIATMTIPAWHQWPGAPAPVGYLGSSHRHLLTLRIECVSLLDDDRTVEFHLLRGAAEAALVKRYPRPGSGLGLGIDVKDRSVEMVAAGLMSDLKAEGWPVVAIECWEDGENGARVEVE